LVAVGLVFGFSSRSIGVQASAQLFSSSSLIQSRSDRRESQKKRPQRSTPRTHWDRDRLSPSDPCAPSGLRHFARMPGALRSRSVLHRGPAHHRPGVPSRLKRQVRRSIAVPAPRKAPARPLDCAQGRRVSAPGAPRSRVFFLPALSVTTDFAPAYFALVYTGSLGRFLCDRSLGAT
jgi:hypothetical protein